MRWDTCCITVADGFRGVVCSRISFVLLVVRIARLSKGREVSLQILSYVFQYSNLVFCQLRFAIPDCVIAEQEGLLVTLTCDPLPPSSYIASS